MQRFHNIIYNMKELRSNKLSSSLGYELARDD